MASRQTADTTPPGVGADAYAANPYAARMITTARPRPIEATRFACQRREARENEDMPAVSQALLEFANHHRQETAPGIEVIATPRYRATIQPDRPIAGPNNVSWIRCRAIEVGPVIREARAIFAPRHLPFMWTLDPETEPSDFAVHLAAHGVHPDPHSAESHVMVLPIEANLMAPPLTGLEIRDALADLETFSLADAAAAEAFQADLPTNVPEFIAILERRRLNFRAAGNRRLLLATVDGEPAGAGGLTLFPPAGAIINGGSVRPKFRGRGVYRALVAARLEIARRAGARGLAVWGGDMSAPILARLGFETVGWRRFYVDTSAV
jgi:GNAT superfamily N-acetyltransferase